MPRLPAASSARARHAARACGHRSRPRCLLTSLGGGRGVGASRPRATSARCPSQRRTLPLLSASASPPSLAWSSPRAAPHAAPAPRPRAQHAPARRAGAAQRCRVLAGACATALSRPRRATTRARAWCVRCRAVPTAVLASVRCASLAEATLGNLSRCRTRCSRTAPYSAPCCASSQRQRARLRLTRA